MINKEEDRIEMVSELESNQNKRKERKDREKEEKWRK